MVEGEASRPAYYKLPACELFTSHTPFSVLSMLSVMSHRRLLGSTADRAHCEMCKKEITQREKELISSCAHTVAHSLLVRDFSYFSSHRSFTTGTDFGFWFFLNNQQASKCIFKAVSGWKRLFVTQPYLGPGSLGEVSRHLCSGINNCTAQCSIESISFSIRSHFVPWVAIIKPICCMKISNCQLECKSQYAQIICF